MEEWAAKWQLRLHPEKCTVLRLWKLNTNMQTKYQMERESCTVPLIKVFSLRSLYCCIFLLKKKN